MNKTLLLILCDFLLLNLLALTNWEQQARPAKHEPRPEPAVRSAAGAATPDEDLVAVMKLSLEDERAQRAQLAEKLDSTESALKDREHVAAETAATLAATQKNAAELAQKFAAASKDATVSKERLAQLQRDLEERQAAAERQAQALAALERQQAEARAKIENLNVAVKVAEQEKQLLRTTADSLKSQVEAERQERLKVQEATTQLAQGVGQLAESSSALTAEIRENRPINANTLFNDFLANRVETSFTATRPGPFGTTANRSKDTRTVFVTDGNATYALLHVSDTPFNLIEPAANWTSLTAAFRKNGYTGPAAELTFLSLDPRVAVLPVTPEQVKALGVKVYQTALEPFKFPEAMLVANGGAGYGEVPFKLDPTNPSYVRMDNRLVRRLFGDFSPSQGDLVFSKTGELLGIMVNSDYCAVVNNFLPAQTIKTGTDLETRPTKGALDDLAARLRKLPARLQ